MPIRRCLVPFAAGVAVGIVVHKYWPERVGRLLDRARASFRERSEKFSDLVAEIRAEEEAAARGRPEPRPSPEGGACS